MTLSLAEIREASREQLRNERAESAQISETTPDDIEDRHLSLAATLNAGDPAFIDVVDDDLGLYGWCSDGVAEKVKADGGKPIFGWTIWEWPRVILTAEFHCVWEVPNGRLVDITPKPKREPRILFVEDRSYPPDFDFDKRPLNRRVNIYQAEDRTAKAREIASALRGTQLAYEQKRADKAGLSLDQWLLRKVPVDPLPRAIDELIAACNEHEEYFETFGAAGYVRPDQKLLELMRRRMDTQAEMKRLLHAAGL